MVMQPLGDVSPRELRDLYLCAERAGCVVTRTKKKHVRLVTPSGVVVFGSGSAGDFRSRLVIRAKLRRAGVQIY